MCGIHGVISTSTAHRSFLSRFFEQGFVVGGVRGMDSSGVFQIGRNAKAYYHKLAIPGSLFVDNKMTKSFINEASFARCTVGHVRHATAGKVNLDNAHPFIGYKKDGSVVIGVHNGTLTGWSYKPGARLFDVDSDWAISRIADEGADAFEDFTGSYAFVWWSEDAPDIIYMARNKERPLHFVLGKDKETMMFCSEPGMLSWLIERNSIDVNSDEIHVIEEGKLYAFDVGQKTISWSKSNLPTPRTYIGTYHGNTNSSSSSTSGSSRSHGSTNTSGTGTIVTTGSQSSTSTSGGNTDESTKRLPPRAVNLLTLFKATLESSPVIVDEDTPIESGPVGDEDDDENIVTFNQPPKGLSKAERKRWRRAQRAVERDRAQLDAIDSGQSCDFDGFGSDMDSVPDGYYNDSAATPNEKVAAKSEGIYGKMMYFIGMYYDPQTSECGGEIEDFVPGGTGKVRYDAVIPNVTASIADRQYVNKVEGTHVVCIGRRSASNYDGGTLVVAEMSKEGVEKYAKALS